jgi:hypothetical protein
MAPPLDKHDPLVRHVLESLEAWGRHAPTLATYIERGNQAAFEKLLEWRTSMARRTFTIELKVDLGDEGERFEPMKDIVLQFATDLLATSALLASDVRPPKVSVFTEDMFMTTEEIEVNLPQDGDEPDDPEVTPEVTQEDTDDGLDV